MIARVLAAAFLAAVLAAVLWQDHGGALPLGLFNEGRGAYAALSWACLAGAAAGLVLLAGEAFRGRPLRAAGILRGLLVSFVLLEALLFLVDVSLASRGDDPPLGGPYRELRTANAEWLFVKKPHAGSALGFRTAEPYPRRSREPRLLFLGDSYTEGSGRAAACNYPEVVTGVVAEHLGRPVALLNAGVAGYGPSDAVRLLAHLLAEGYEADAIVFGLFLENDFGDNLPGTTRRVVAGVNFRFPESPFLRIFHPLNSRSFRYALFVERASRLVRGSGARARRDAGACRLAPEAVPTEAPAGLLHLARRRLAANYGPAARSAIGEVEAALGGLRRLAAERPVFVVVFPDRVLVDEALAQAAGADPRVHDLGRLGAWLDVAWPGAIRVAPALGAGAENYRPNDTHLSDLGNLRAGRHVGAALAERLAGAPGW